MLFLSWSYLSLVTSAAHDLRRDRPRKLKPPLVLKQTRPCINFVVSFGNKQIFGPESAHKSVENLSVLSSIYKYIYLYNWFFTRSGNLLRGLRSNICRGCTFYEKSLPCAMLSGTAWNTFPKRLSKQEGQFRHVTLNARTIRSDLILVLFLSQDCGFRFL